jgi:UDP-N-acetylmuramate--alanine ligase
VHFVGVGGIGMSGIAELLANLGYTVSGSDQRRSETTDRLAALGVSVREGHAAAHVGDADVVVVSSAVRADNPEVIEARGRYIPVIPRAEMLAELMRLRSGIAVAGAHGKTSTTSMIALALERAGLDPTAVIGGRLRAFGSNARLGSGEYMVVEADESDRSFLKLSPTIAVVTNVDREHLEAYGGFEDLQQAFVDFANKVPFYGAIIACADDTELARLLPRMARRVITYGSAAEHAEIAAVDVRLSGFGSTCTVVRRPPHPQPGEIPAARTLGTLRLQVPGRHSVLNALAAVGVGLELAVPFEVLAAALADFQGAERRFERRGVVHGITVVDDYGHHPTEITAVLAAARAAGPARVIVAFQPHRYSRTAQLMPEFAAALAAADEVVLTDIYAAGEDAIPGVDVEALAAAANRRRDRPVSVVRALDRVAPTVAALAAPGDLVITLGAGSIGGVASQVVRELERLHGTEVAS